MNTTTAMRDAPPEAAVRAETPVAEAPSVTTIFSNPDFVGHEALHAFHHRPSSLKGFIAIHSTALGPAFGGCRMWDYASETQAIRDALRLSRGMSYKNALAGLAYGGGKAVIMGDPRVHKTQALFEAFGDVVQSLDGRYITAEDVGIKVADMEIVGRRTEFVSGIVKEGRMAGGDPSPMTARGVFQGLRAAVKFKLGRDDLEGLRVAVQGVGNVGYNLCRLLHKAGAELLVADVYRPNLDRAQRELGAQIVDTDAILFQDVDVIAPCALGGVIAEDTIPDLKARVIAGAANNQLASDLDGERLKARGILYAPDYVVNSGGIITVASEYEGGAPEREVTARIDRIYERTLAIFERAKREDRPTSDIADQMAREVIAAAMPA